jgi:hypothetical protein
MGLQRLVYRSVASSTNSSRELDRIVASSRTKNRRLGITGAIALHEERFVQVLEGREEQLSELLASIMNDKRHSKLRVLGRWTVSARLFPSWSMATATAIHSDPKSRRSLLVEEYGAALVGAMLSLTNNVPWEV